MIESYRPEFFDEVKAFARKLANFDYVKHIIKAHTEQHAPGGCWVWRERAARSATRGKRPAARIVAFCAMLYMNADDAWLYGMRVDNRYKSRGIASKFTRRLFRIAGASGRTWAGLNTLDHRPPAPVFRVAEKLGMRLEAIHATDPFWNLPARFKPPRLRRLPGIFRHYTRLGQRVIFREDPGWLWFRLLPARARSVNEFGCNLRGLPIHVQRHPVHREGKKWWRSTTVNLYDRPPDFHALLKALFGLAAGPHRGLTINYPAEWRHELRRAARDLLPRTRRGKRYWFTVWRIYGKDLPPSGQTKVSARCGVQQL